MKYFGLEEYDFFGRSGKSSWKHWEIWYSHKRILAVVGILMAYMLQFFGTFFSTNALKFLVLGNVGSLRVPVWISIGHILMHEFNSYIKEDKSANKSAPGRVHTECIWIGLMIGALETHIAFHWSDKAFFHFTGGMSLTSACLWACGFTLIFARFVYLKFIDCKKLSIDKFEKNNYRALL